MQLDVEILMKAVLADPDAALEAGWSPRHWEAHGFMAMARRRIQEVGQLRVVLASLGASDLIRTMRGYDNHEKVEIVDCPFISF